MQEDTLSTSGRPESGSKISYQMSLNQESLTTQWCSLKGNAGLIKSKKKLSCLRV